MRKQQLQANHPKRRMKRKSTEKNNLRGTIVNYANIFNDFERPSGVTFRCCCFIYYYFFSFSISLRPATSRIASLQREHPTDSSTKNKQKIMNNYCYKYARGERSGLSVCLSVFISPHSNSHHFHFSSSFSIIIFF